MGYRTAIAYPAALVLSQIQPLFQVLVFFFVAKLVDRSGPAVGGDYFTFVVLGWAGVQMLQAGLGAFSTEVNFAVQQGRFEMFLVEPIRWRLLPLGLVQWPIIQKSLAVAFLLLVSALLRSQLQGCWVTSSRGRASSVSVASMAMSIISGAMVIFAKQRPGDFLGSTLAAFLLFRVHSSPIDCFRHAFRVLRRCCLEPTSSRRSGERSCRRSSSCSRCVAAEQAALGLLMASS